MPRPNCFVIGAPKCGTSTIYSYLEPHPQVFMSSMKEPHFFAEQSAYRFIDTMDMYMDLFKPAEGKPQYKVIGEASTTYFHTPGAIEAVHEFAPDAKIIAAVRNPVELVQSLHGHLLFWQLEDVEDFEDAWRLWPQRAKGEMMPKVIKKPDRTQLSYGEMGLLGKHLKHVLEVFPKEQVHVIVFDDIKKNPRGVYEDLLRFVEVEVDDRSEFGQKNVTRSHGKLSAVTKLAASVPAPVRRIAHKVGLSNTGIIAGISSRFASTQKREAINPELESELVEFYRDDVALLSELLGRDLSHWLKGSASGRVDVAPNSQ